VCCNVLCTSWRDAVRNNTHHAALHDTCNTLQHTVTHCNALQHTATRRNIEPLMKFDTLAGRLLHPK